jgi:hypothetical protein
MKPPPLAKPAWTRMQCGRWWKPLSTRERLLVCATICLVSVVAIRFAIGLMPPKPLTVVADQSLADALSGDGSNLYSEIMPIEMETTHMTRQQFNNMMEWVHECLRGYSTTSGAVHQGIADGRAVSASIELKKDSDRSTIGIQVYSTPDGPKVFTLPLVMAALVAKYGHKYQQQPDGTRIWLAVRDGTQAELETLKSFGPGVCQTDPSKGELITWQELHKRATRYADYLSQPEGHRVMAND